MTLCLLATWMTFPACQLATQPHLPRPRAVVVSATGIGRPPPRMRGPRARLMARRAAEVNAVRNLALKLGLGEKANVSGFRYVSERSLPGGAVEVTVEKVIGYQRC